MKETKLTRTAIEKARTLVNQSRETRTKTGRHPPLPEGAVAVIAAMRCRGDRYDTIQKALGVSKATVRNSLARARRLGLDTGPRHVYGILPPARSFSDLCKWLKDRRAAGYEKRLEFPPNSDEILARFQVRTGFTARQIADALGVTESKCCRMMNPIKGRHAALVAQYKKEEEA